MLLADIASENRHAADTDAEREERMRERREDGFADTLARLCQAFERRQEVELEPCGGTRQRNGADGEKYHDDKQADHHLLGDSLDAFLETEGDDAEAKRDGDAHPENHERGVREHFAEAGRNLVGSSLEETCVGDHLVEVVEHPARHHRVEGHQDVVRRNQRELGPVPLGARLFQVVEGAGDTTTAATAKRKFRYQDREPEEQQEAEIGQHECRTAVLACDVRETPHVAEADGASGSDENKTESGFKVFSFHVRKNSKLFSKSRWTPRRLR